MKKSREFYRNQIIFILLSLPIGAVIGAICALFGIVLLRITDFRTEHYLFLLPLLGIAGVFITYCYEKFGKDSAKGMSLIFELEQGKREHIPLRLVPMVMVSTWLTHLFGGSAGREGVAVQIGGDLGAFAGGKTEDTECTDRSHDRRNGGWLRRPVPHPPCCGVLCGRGLHGGKPGI